MTGITPDKVNNHIKATIDAIIAQAEILKGAESDPILEGTNKGSLERGGCVYTIIHPYTNGIKIGKTNNLRNRMRGLCYELSSNDKIMPTIVLVFYTPHYEILERLLHYHLRDANIKNEWFDIDKFAVWAREILETTNG